MSIFTNIINKMKKNTTATPSEEPVAVVSEPVHSDDTVVTTPKPVATYDTKIATETPMQRAFREAQERNSK